MVSNLAYVLTSPAGSAQSRTMHTAESAYGTDFHPIQDDGLDEFDQMFSTHHHQQQAHPPQPASAPQGMLFDPSFAPHPQQHQQQQHHQAQNVPNDFHAVYPNDFGFDHFAEYRNHAVPDDALSTSGSSSSGNLSDYSVGSADVAYTGQQQHYGDFGHQQQQHQQHQQQQQHLQPAYAGHYTTEPNTHDAFGGGGPGNSSHESLHQPAHDGGASYSGGDLAYNAAALGNGTSAPYTVHHHSHPQPHPDTDGFNNTSANHHHHHHPQSNAQYGHSRDSLGSDGSWLSATQAQMQSMYLDGGGATTAAAQAHAYQQQQQTAASASGRPVAHRSDSNASSYHSGAGPGSFNGGSVPHSPAPGQGLDMFDVQPQHPYQPSSSQGGQAGFSSPFGSSAAQVPMPNGAPLTPLMDGLSIDFQQQQAQAAAAHHQQQIANGGGWPTAPLSPAQIQYASSSSASSSASTSSSVGVSGGAGGPHRNSANIRSRSSAAASSPYPRPNYHSRDPTHMNPASSHGQQAYLQQQAQNNAAAMPLTPGVDGAGPYAALNLQPPSNPSSAHNTPSRGSDASVQRQKRPREIAEEDQRGASLSRSNTSSRASSFSSNQSGTSMTSDHHAGHRHPHHPHHHVHSAHGGSTKTPPGMIPGTPTHPDILRPMHVEPPVPIQGLTKKSRGRQVPTVGNATSSSSPAGPSSVASDAATNGSVSASVATGNASERQKSLMVGPGVVSPASSAANNNGGPHNSLMGSVTTSRQAWPLSAGGAAAEQGSIFPQSASPWGPSGSGLPSSSNTGVRRGGVQPVLGSMGTMVDDRDMANRARSGKQAATASAPRASASNGKGKSPANEDAAAEDDQAATPGGDVRLGRPFVCEVPGCGNAYQRNEHLRRHVRSIHTNDRPYECLYEGCHRQFNRYDNLCQHVRGVHRRDPPENHR